jgi:trans-2,3-dihydro-3-hydroxyanthranilate isomerase
MRSTRLPSSKGGIGALARDFAIYDVFTDAPLAGNPLAVVFDGDGLADERMQAIAREFNLSETIFFLPAEKANHTAQTRIFSTHRELPFAGHPTIGGAIALAERTHGTGSIDLDLVQMLEEKIGPIRCAVRLAKGGPSFCEFDLPRLSVNHPAEVSREAVAAALGVGPHEIGFENHVIGCWSAGVPYLLVPLRDIGAVERARCDAAMWESLAPMADGQLAFAYVYCRGGVRHDAAYHARMFAPHEGMWEDPATGSAAAALSGAIHRFDGLLDGNHARIVEQGVEMERPSLIHLHIEVEAGAVSRVRICGQAVKIATGQIFV